jgi:hypothetical protein
MRVIIGGSAENEILEPCYGRILASCWNSSRYRRKVES